MLNEIKDKFNDLTEGNANKREDAGSSKRYGSSQYGSSNQGNQFGSSNQKNQYGSSHQENEGSDFGKYSRSGSSQGYGSTPRYRSSSDYSSSSYDYGHSSGGSSGKVWIAALAGASAGLIAGMLMAPETGKETRQSLKRSMGNWGDELDRTVKSVFGKLEDMNLTGTGSSLNLKGNWNEAKGKLKQQYSQLTDDDLNYLEGNEDEFVGNLQRKLGKTKREIYDLLGQDKNRM